MYTYLHSYICTHMHTYIYIGFYLSIYVHIHQYSSKDMHTHLHTHVHVYKLIYIYAHMFAYFHCMYVCMHACIYIYTYVHVRICIWPGFHGEHFFKINQGILQYQISGQHLISFRAGLRQGTYSAVKGLELEEVQTMLRCHAQNFGWMNFSIWPILRSFLGYFNYDHPSTNPKGMDGVH